MTAAASAATARTVKAIKVRVLFINFFSLLSILCRFLLSFAVFVFKAIKFHFAVWLLYVQKAVTACNYSLVVVVAFVFC